MLCFYSALQYATVLSGRMKLVRTEPYRHIILGKQSDLEVIGTFVLKHGVLKKAQSVPRLSKFKITALITTLTLALLRCIFGTISLAFISVAVLCVCMCLYKQ